MRGTNPSTAAVEKLLETENWVVKMWKLGRAGNTTDSLVSESCLQLLL